MAFGKVVIYSRPLVAYTYNAAIRMHAHPE